MASSQLWRIVVWLAHIADRGCGHFIPDAPVRCLSMIGMILRKFRQIAIVVPKSQKFQLK